MASDAEFAGYGSGFFNFGLPTALSTEPGDIASAFNSGFLNAGAALSGIFGLGRLLG
ncbi:hypothetical protein [Mycobacterium asiaticum]|uniref:hypothetical protein n=1 Tax=Mycobacterium asiaticum TaxID=1790 RepID=UPI000B2AD15B|nr:hypothetical protein [Mycobacterium asiaticum]